MIICQKNKFPDYPYSIRKLMFLACEALISSLFCNMIKGEGFFLLQKDFFFQYVLISICFLLYRTIHHFVKFLFLG